MSFANKENPVTSGCYLRLQTAIELQKKTIRKFYKIIKTYSPSGVITIYEVVNKNGDPTQAYLVHKMDDNGNNIYEIPLTRDLTSNEIYEIVVQLDRVLNEGDFIFETSTEDNNCCPHEDDLIETFERDVYEELAERLAKITHNNWLEKRVEHGWVLGDRRSDKNKTHPLIKQWDLLNEEQKAIDYDLPKNMIDILTEYGYTIIRIDELNALLK